MPLADCWYEVHPRSTAKRQTAAKEARREIMWLRENHRLHVEDELYIQDMGPERMVEQLKEQLEANRPFPTKDGNLIDSGFPDWRARYQATKTLMILLGIASRGFEPILDQGEKQNPPVEPITVADALRKSKAEAIILRHHVEGLTLAKSWRRLHPSSGASNKTATKNARELLAWYDGTISHEMRPLCVAAGLSEDTVVEQITEMDRATLLIKDDDRFVDSEFPNWSDRKKARELWMVSLGISLRDGPLNPLLLGEKVAFAQPQKAEASDQGQHGTRATRETRDEKGAPVSHSPSPSTLNKDKDRSVDSESPDGSALKKAVEMVLKNVAISLRNGPLNPAFAQPQKAEASDQGQHGTRATRETRDEKGAPASHSPSPSTLNKDKDRSVDSESPDGSALKKAVEMVLKNVAISLRNGPLNPAFAQPQKAEASDQGQHDTRATRETRDEKRAPASPSLSPAPERQRPRTATRNRRRRRKRRERMTLTDARRRYYAETMLLLRLRDHTPAESWYETHPDSKAKPESARVLAQDEFAWYQRRYPNGLDELRRRAQSPPEQRHWRKRRNPDLIIAEMIVYLFIVEKHTLGECWQLVCPVSTATPNSARGRAQRAATRYLRQFPEEIHIAVQRGSRAVRESLRDAA